MKIRLTIDQFKKVLKTEKPKFPITIIMKGIDKEELKALVKTLKDNRKV